ncbi:glycosyl transferase [Arthrobacter sp. MYb227]|uniref:glycosyltransferase family 2 protein n=1 Tax=Arthrobacter sp. MYb227 TaxID=1848601 RepID=UPI000CFC90DF|nr:glycosyltransferase family A protein [Arthrobacter sp. MYb227]PQZ91085.1 glycosyl transferase [Arthrobacter sp. MYb227]
MNKREFLPSKQTAQCLRSVGTLDESLVIKFNKEVLKPALVSVVIPCFNYGRYLSDAVQSVLSQAGVEIEIIIVDDCSTDGSQEIANDLAANYACVQVVLHETNLGPVKTFNDGLALATGEFLVRLDADDLLTPGALQRAVRVFLDHRNVGLVYGRPIHFSGSILPTARQKATKVVLWPGLSWLERRCRDGLNVITSPEVVMRKSVVDMVGGQMPLAHTHDMEMWFRISAFSDVAYVRGCDQAWHREHALSLSTRLVDILTDLEERRAAFDMLFSGIAATESWVPKLQVLAAEALDSASLSLASHELDLGAPNRGLLDSLLKEARGSNERNLQTVERLRARIEGADSVHNQLVGFLHRIWGRAQAALSRRRWLRYGEY